MKPPSSLSKRSAGLWQSITSDFQLETTELELLRLALEAIDRCEEARSVIASDGLTSRGRYGQVLPHPMIGVERDSRLAAARLFKQLALAEALSESVSPLQLRPRRAS